MDGFGDDSILERVVGTPVLGTLGFLGYLCG